RRYDLPSAVAADRPDVGALVDRAPCSVPRLPGVRLLAEVSSLHDPSVHVHPDPANACDRVRGCTCGGVALAALPAIRSLLRQAGLHELPAPGAKPGRLSTTDTCPGSAYLAGLRDLGARLALRLPILG